MHSIANRTGGKRNKKRKYPTTKYGHLTIEQIVEKTGLSNFQIYKRMQTSETVDHIINTIENGIY